MTAPKDDLYIKTIPSPSYEEIFYHPQGDA